MASKGNQRVSVPVTLLDTHCALSSTACRKDMCVDHGLEKIRATQHRAVSSFISVGLTVCLMWQPSIFPFGISTSLADGVLARAAERAGSFCAARRNRCSADRLLGRASASFRRFSIHIAGACLAKFRWHSARLQSVSIC